MVRYRSPSAQSITPRIHPGRLYIVSILTILVRKLGVHITIIILIAVVVPTLLGWVSLNPYLFTIEISLLLQILLLLLQVVKPPSIILLPLLIVGIASRVHSLHIILVVTNRIVVLVRITLHIGQPRNVRIPFLMVPHSLVVVLFLNRLIHFSLVVKQFLHELEVHEVFVVVVFTRPIIF